ncbi:MAG: hypothetical protein WDN45_01945 [Caulobacteraceae bacterium]
MPPVPTSGLATSEPPGPPPEDPTAPPAMLPDPSWSASQPHKRVQTPARKAEPTLKHVYLLAFAATVLWAGGLTAYTLGLRARVGPFEAEPFAIAILAVLGLAPVGLIWIGAYALRQGSRLMSELNRLERLSNDMIVPAALAAAEVGSAVQSIRKEIQSAVSAADRARSDLMHLKDLLTLEGDRLIEMASGSARTASGLVQDLGRERQEFGVLQGKLETRVGEINDSIGATPRWFRRPPTWPRPRFTRPRRPWRPAPPTWPPPPARRWKRPRWPGTTCSARPRAWSRPAPPWASRCRWWRRTSASSAPPWCRWPTPCAPTRKTWRCTSRATAPSWRRCCATPSRARCRSAKWPSWPARPCAT